MTSAQTQTKTITELLGQYQEGIETLQVIRQSVSDPEKLRQIDWMISEAQANYDLTERRHQIWARRSVLRSLSQRLTAEEQEHQDRLDALVEASSESEGE